MCSLQAALNDGIVLSFLIIIMYVNAHASHTHTHTAPPPNKHPTLTCGPAQPRGNAMLVGVGGSGKQSLTRLAAHMCGFKVFQIELSRGYGAAEFRADLAKLYHTAGVKGEPVVFLFSDTQIVQESFLEDINNMLNSGKYSGLSAYAGMCPVLA